MDRRLATAVLAVLALLVQALIPAAALAGCSHHTTAQAEAGMAPGVHCANCPPDHAAEQGEPAPERSMPEHGGFAGLPCHHCVAVTIAAVAPPALAVIPVRYVDVAAPAAPQTPEAVADAPTIRLLPPSTAPPTV